MPKNHRYLEHLSDLVCAEAALATRRELLSVFHQCFISGLRKHDFRCEDLSTPPSCFRTERAARARFVPVIPMRGSFPESMASSADSQPLDQWRNVIAHQAVDNFMGAGVPEDGGRVGGGHADGVHARGTGGLDAEGGVFEDGRA